jgi:hypothetical protein
MKGPSMNQKMKGHAMKRSYSAVKMTRWGGLFAAVLALAALMPVSGLSQEKGAAKLMKPIKTVEDIQALQTGDEIAMACPKCKTVMVTQVVREKSQPMTKSTMQHLCPGCETKFEVKGHGKDKKEVPIHICNTCGSKDVFCCVTKKSAGPTKGMEEKK